jgi:3-phosphoshikimate 1-carboxyvinyltransferase
VTLTVSPAATLQGEFRPPSDKSLTHRAYMLAALADGPCEVEAPLRGEDCEATLRCLVQMGLRHEWVAPDRVRLIPTREWTSPMAPLDCGNSGTTMRLLAGLIASRPIMATLTGDASLSGRPMGRIAEPLRLMGGEVEGERPPITVRGGSLRGIHYATPVASAQIKSCVLLAGLRAEGPTTVVEPAPSRDHTERMLRALGADLVVDGTEVRLNPGFRPSGFSFRVPADVSSAAFFLTAAAMLPGAQATAREVGINPTRVGALEVLAQAGAHVELGAAREAMGEPVADVAVRHSGRLEAFEIGGDLVPRLVDEIPVLAVLASQCHGTSFIRDARELRVKESDRIETVAAGLRAMGAEVLAFEDGLAVKGPIRLRGATIDVRHDHRIAMAFAVAGLIAEGETRIEGAEAIATSYPAFEEDLMGLSVV